MSAGRRLTPIVTPSNTAKVTVGATKRGAALIAWVEQQLLTGQITPGQRLGTKKDLQRELQVSQGTLNEALRVLEARGLITLRPGPAGGVFASTPDGHVQLANVILGLRAHATTIQHAVRVRNVLEPLIWTEAALYATKDDVASLDGSVAGMAEHLADPSKYLALNWQLHRRAAAITPNKILGSLYLALLDFVDSNVSEVKATDEFSRTSTANLRVHRALVDAVRESDGIAAAAAAEEHDAAFASPPRPTATADDAPEL